MVSKNSRLRTCDLQHLKIETVTQTSCKLQTILVTKHLASTVPFYPIPTTNMKNTTTLNWQMEGNHSVGFQIPLVQVCEQGQTLLPCTGTFASIHGWCKSHHILCCDGLEFPLCRGGGSPIPVWPPRNTWKFSLRALPVSHVKTDSMICPQYPQLFFSTSSLQEVHAWLEVVCSNHRSKNSDFWDPGVAFTMDSPSENQHGTTTS